MPRLTGGCGLIVGIAVVAACAAPVPSAPWHLRGVVTTWLGRSGECTVLDGDRRSARANRIDAIAAAPDGGLFVVEGRDGVIRRASPDGSVSTVAGTLGAPGLQDGAAGAARVAFAGWGASVDEAGRLFFTDVENNAVRRLSRSGGVSTVIGVPWHGDEIPLGGHFPLSGPADAVYLISPFAVAADRTGLLVADEITDSVRWLHDGVVSLLWGGGRWIQPDAGTGSMLPGHPLGIAVGTDGTIWVHDGYSAVYRVSTSGDLAAVAGTPGSSGDADGVGPGARFTELSGMAIGPDGAAYVLDGSAVRRIASDGAVTTVAGSVLEPGDADGPGALARFGSGGSLTFGTDGALYVGDSEHCTIRRVD